MEATERNTIDRPHDPIVFRGNVLPRWLGQHIGRILGYVYMDSLGQWRQIPLQIDEVAPDGNYFSEMDSILDDNDEVAFLSRDLGDKALAHHWIDNLDSRQFVRYQITITDPLDPSKRGWLYLYFSPTLMDTNTIDYVWARQGASGDTIFSTNYHLAYDSQGQLTYLLIPQEAGGTGVDLFDRLKIRLSGAVKIGFITVPYKVDENNIQLVTSRIKDGVVRIIRQAEIQIQILIFSGSGVATSQFFEAYAIGGSGSVDLKSEYGATLIRQSQDLSADAVGMSFHNPYNENIPIDGSPDPVDATLPTSGIFWGMVTGDQGTILTIWDVPDAGNPQLLYYWDNQAGGTADGTDETGDGASYGDMGLLFRNPRPGRYSFAYSNYFLPGNQPRSIGETYASYFEHPLQIAVKPDVCLDQFRIAELSERGLLFSWNETPATHYTVYRDTLPYFTPGPENRLATNVTDQEPDSAGTQWWDELSTVGNPAVQSFYTITATVEGLETNPTRQLGEWDFTLASPPDRTHHNPVALIFDTRYAPRRIQKASDLAALIPGCDLVSRWDATRQNWQSYAPPLPFTDFEIRPYEGLLVSVQQDTLWTHLGALLPLPPVFHLIAPPDKTHNNAIVVPLGAPWRRASELAASIPGCDLVSRWDVGQQTWISYVPELPFTDFDIAPGEFLLVSVSAPVDWPQPSQLSPYDPMVSQTDPKTPFK